MRRHTAGLHRQRLFRRCRPSTFSRIPAFETLEDRRLLATDLGEPFAFFQDVASDATPTRITVRAEDFPGSGDMRLVGFLASTTNGSGNPEPVSITSVATGEPLTPMISVDDVDPAGSSLTIFALPSGQFDVTATGSAALDLETILVGDFDGDFDVDEDDLRIWTRSTSLETGVSVGDYNEDGAANATDYTVWRNTLGTTGVDPGSGADGNVNGEIDTVDYLIWKVNFGRVDGQLLASEIIPGDYNADGTVTLVDYTLWRDSLNGADADPATDGNGDGIVDEDDYDVWRQSYGQTLVWGDADFDGDSDTQDLQLWQSNFGRSTTIRPLTISASAGTGATGSLQVFDDQPFRITGVTAAESTVEVDVNGDSVAEQTTTAGSNGQFAVQIQVPDAGPQSIHVLATDPFGQWVTMSVTVNAAESFRISEVSPRGGEQLVSVTREGIVRIAETVDPATITASSVQFIANGVPLPGRLVVSSTNRFVTFFPDTPWPASTAVRVVIVGDQITAQNGDRLDADGNGTPGGRFQADFRTLSLARLPNTNVFGFVRDSTTGEPIVGATIRVDAFPEANAVTDETGRFELVDMPAPEFFVHIDGSTALNTPEGFAYPSVGKPFHSVPGQTVQLNMQGTPFDIYLPPMATGDVQSLNATEPTDVGFGADGQQRIADMFPDLDPAIFDQMAVTFAPGAAVDDQGNAATDAVVIPVPPDRIPAPLPPNLNPELVVSIQAMGASNFDVPAPVSFPNVEGLAPGEKTLVFSFDHDAGVWKPIGTATVSDDGMAVVSDPDTGVLAPGWHFAFPSVLFDAETYSHDIDVPGSLVEAFRQSAASILADLSTLASAIDVVVDLAQIIVEGAFLISLVDVIPGDEELLAAAYLYSETVGEQLDVGLDYWSITLSYASDVLANDTFVPSQSFLEGLYLSLQATGADHGLFPFLQDDLASLPFEMQGLAGGYATSVEQHSRALAANEQFRDSLAAWATMLSGKFVNTDRLRDDIERITNDVIKTVEKTRRELDDIARIRKFIHDLERALRGEVPLPLIPPGEFPVPQPNPFEFPLSPDDFIQQLQLRTLGESQGGPAELIDEDVASALRVSAATASAAAQRLLMSSDGVTMREVLESRADQFRVFQQQLSHVIALGLDNSSNAFYAISGLDGSVIRGRADSSGALSVTLPAGADVEVSFFDPLTTHVWRERLVTGAAGSSMRSSQVVLGIDSEDDDEDGLSNTAEFVIGTSIDSADTDNDGISDLAEIEQGLDPLGGFGFPTGVIASLPLQGTAREVVVEGTPEGQLAYVATGDYGLAIADVSQFNNPIALGQLDLPGDATDVAVDPVLNIAVVASNAGGLHFVDVADPQIPRLIKTVEVAASQVEVTGGVVFAGAGKSLRSFDILSQQALQNIALPRSGTITGLARYGDNLFGYRGSTFFSVDASVPVEAKVVGNLDVPIASSLVRVQADQNVAYLIGSGIRTVDVTNPSSPFLIADAELPFAGEDIALNGSGLALVASGSLLAGVGLFDVSDPQQTNAFLTQFDPPGIPSGVTIASGIGYVAAGNAGLSVVNYRPFDNQGVPPTVSFTTSIVGDQIEEGSQHAIDIEVSDDVQVRRVDVLLNEDVVASDVSFPFDLRFAVPRLHDATSLGLSVRAVDTGGNMSTAPVQSFDILPDITPPHIIASTPDESSVIPGVNSVSLFASEPIDASQVDLAAFSLLDLGADGAPGGGDDAPMSLTEVRVFGDRRISVRTASPLDFGHYQLTVDSLAVVDSAGNRMQSPFTLLFRSFDVVSDAVRWIVDTDGDWHEPGNWNLGRVPGTDDDVIINRLAADPIVTIADADAMVASLSSEESIVISGQSLTIAGVGVLNGPTTVNSGGSIQASTSGSAVAILGESVIDGGNLYASDGGLLSLPGLTTLAGSISTGVDTAIEASGVGSRVELANVTELVGATVGVNVDLFIRSLDGGVVDLSGATRITQPADPINGTVQVTADGAGSVVDLSSLTEVVDVDMLNSTLDAQNGGELRVPNLTSVNGFRINSRAGATLPTSQLETLQNGRLIAFGVTPELSALTNIDGSSLIAQDGGVLSLPGVTSYAAQAMFAVDRAIEASGAGSRVELANVTELVGATVGVNVDLFIRSLDGGLVDLSRATRITQPADPINGTVQVTADGAGSLVDLSSLTEVFDFDRLNSTLDAMNGGEVRVPILTSVNGFHINSRAGATLPTSQLEMLQNGLLIAFGVTPELSALTNVDGSSLIAQDGGVLALPGVASYAAQAMFAVDRAIEASGAGSRVELANVTELVGATVGVNVDLFIRSLDGGVVDLSGATRITQPADPINGTVQVTADGAGSVVDLSSLTEVFDFDRLNSTLDALNGGEVRVPNLTSVNGLHITSRAGATLPTSQLETLQNGRLIAFGVTPELSALTNVDGSSLIAQDGGVLALPGVTSYAAQAMFAVDRAIEASGAGSRVELPNVRTLVGGTGVNVELFVEALEGGEIDLSNLQEITGGATQVLADGIGSTVDVSALTRYVDTNNNGVSRLETRNEGTITTANLATLGAVQITVTGSAAAPNLDALTNLDSSSILVTGGGNLTLPSLASYTGGTTNSFDTFLRATGAGSVLALPNVVTLIGGTAFNAELFIEALEGGVVDLGALEAITGGASQVLADGAASTIDLTALTSFVDDNPNGDSRLEERNGGEIVVPNLAETVDVEVLLGGSGIGAADPIEAFADAVRSSAPPPDMGPTFRQPQRRRTILLERAGQAIPHDWELLELGGRLAFAEVPFDALASRHARDQSHRFFDLADDPWKVREGWLDLIDTVFAGLA